MYLKAEFTAEAKEQSLVHVKEMEGMMENKQMAVRQILSITGVEAS